METIMNIFLGRKRDIYHPHLIISKTVTLMELVSMVDGNNFREAFVILLLLNDAIPAFIA